MDNREGTVLQHGIFPEIRCAWELLDHSLLLWPCDGDGQPIWEYRSEKQPISALGLVKPRPDFVEDTAAHQYLLVLATPLELLLFGVCCCSSQDGEDTLSRQVSVEKLVDYSTTSSDGVTMTSIASTDKGRIFLAGHNGLIYEQLYTIGSPCRLVCCTPPPPMPVLCPDANEWDERLSRDRASVVDLLKEMRNNYSLFNKHFSDRSRFWFRDFDHVVEMVVDNERKILHARTKEAALKAYFLGMNGESPIEKLGQVDNLLDHHSPDTAAAGASRTNKLSIVSISPLSSKMEFNAHLVAVLSDCTRIYLSTSSSSQSSTNCLRVVTTPNLTIDQTKGLSTKAEIAYCSTLGNCELGRGLSEDNMFYSLGDSTILQSTSRYVPSQFMRKRVNIESFRRQEARMCDVIEKRKHAMSKKIM